MRSRAYFFPPARLASASISHSSHRGSDRPSSCAIRTAAALTDGLTRKRRAAAGRGLLCAGVRLAIDQDDAWGRKQVKTLWRINNALDGTAGGSAGTALRSHPNALSE